MKTANRTKCAEIYSSRIPGESRKVLNKMLKFALLLFVTGAPTLLVMVQAGGHGHGHRHVIIHVPYKVKTIHHTHTITKHIHHKDGGDKYEVLGYTVGHPIDLGGEHGHEHGGVSGHYFGGGNELSGGHDFGGADWSGGIGEGVEAGSHESGLEGGHISGYEYQEGGHAGLGGSEFSSGGYGGHEEYSGH